MRIISIYIVHCTMYIVITLRCNNVVIALHYYYYKLLLHYSVPIFIYRFIACNHIISSTFHSAIISNSTLGIVTLYNYNQRNYFDSA